MAGSSDQGWGERGETSCCRPSEGIAGLAQALRREEGGWWSGTGSAKKASGQL